MKNIFTKVIAFAMIFTLIFSNTIKTEAAAYGTISQNVYAVVTEVFDGESFEAKDINNNTYYLVKMIGVNSKGYDDAYEYTYNRLMGKQVLLTLDTTVNSPVNRWNYCYVRENGEVVNTKLIALGYGVANINTSTPTIYNQYASIQEDAKSDNVGMWGIPDIDGTVVTTKNSEDAININTASASQLQSYLTNVNSTLAKNIVDYRKYNPFNQVSDVKFVEGMTKAIYDKNKDLMHVVTNINDTYEKELSTLKDISDSEAEDIYEYLQNKNYKVTIDDLLDDDIITSSEYSANKNYLTDSSEIRIIYTINSYAANINKATKTQLTNTGLSSSNASAIVNITDKGYTFKTLGEIQFNSDFSLTDVGLRRLLDNLKVKTDINYSNKYELESLFGSGYSGLSDDIEEIIDARKITNLDKVKNIVSTTQYEKIKNFIYIDSYSTNYVNINTATKEQLISIGINSSVAQKIVNKQNSGIMYDYTDLPSDVDLRSFDQSISLFTNINNTSVLELTSLSEKMTTTAANAIINYAKDQPFGSMEEFKLFMNNNDYSAIYNDIEDFIVLY